MKNIIKTLILFLVCAGISSCDNSVGYPDPGPAGNPEKDIEGVYTGTWTRTLDGNSVEGQGSITFTPGENAYTTNVAVSCPEFGIELNGVANVVNYSEGYKFYNQDAKGNGFGVVFDGRVVNGIAYIKFTITQKEGRKQYLYNYNFSGGK